MPASGPGADARRRGADAASRIARRSIFSIASLALLLYSTGAYAVGGTDNAGCYAFSDTILPLDGEAPTFSFTDVSGTGTPLVLSDDVVSAALPIGFTFNYYGIAYTDVYVSSNGFLTFLSGQNNGCCSGQPIPGSGSPNAIVAAWWEDILPASGGGTIHYETIGAAPNREFVVQFTNTPHFSSGNPVTMQFKLFETSHDIEVHYVDAPTDGGQHSAGIENEDGTIGVQWQFGGAIALTNTAVRYFADTGLSGDGDGDGVAECLDNCPADANAGQEDVDGDGFGDACDACVGNGVDDVDGDGICALDDNCPTIANPGQEDFNNDGIGDACSPQVSIDAIAPSGGDLDATVTVGNPLMLPISGNVAVLDCANLEDVTFTWLATTCNGTDDLFELLVNGVVVATVDPDPTNGCTCTPAAIGSHSVPLATILPLLTGGPNTFGVRKASTPGDATALAWAYATVTLSGSPTVVEIFDEGGGDSYDNPDLCGSLYTFGTVDASTAEPAPACSLQASHAWSGTLPCGIDISTLGSQDYVLVVTATDGVVPQPVGDAEVFPHAAEATLFINGGGCDDANLCTVDTCDAGGTGQCVNTAGNAGAECRGAAGVCDVAEVCDGVSSECPADAKSTAVCRAATGACDAVESCDGVGDDCPADELQPDGASCSDGAFCNGSETCLGGSCQSGAEPCLLACDEGGDVCETGCPAEPLTCRSSEKGIVILKDKDDNGKDKLVWKWIKGESTSQTELGDPTSSADYALCLYAGTTAALVGEAVVPPSASLWSEISDKGYKYKDKALSADGVQKIVLKGSDNNKSKALLKGKGTGLPDLSLPLSLPVVVQLINGDTGVCMDTTFQNADVKKNEADQFKAKATAP